MKILLAIDDSPCSQAAVDSVIAQFRPDDCEVRVVHVDEWPKGLPAPLAFTEGPDVVSSVLAAHDEMRQRANELIDDSKRRLQAAKFRVTTEIRAGDARHAILDSAAEWQPDLIVIGSHGRRGFDRLLLGSVSENVVRHATCSVDVIREPRAAA